jgi:hypothetical protein
MKRTISLICQLTILVVCIIGQTQYNVQAADVEGKCATANQYTCEGACGGVVSDCLECDGYLNTGKVIKT